ncbi:ORF6N domain-containing protein [Treponema sp.]|uniref:ORF6N domain-containing protein n=1 Tax=Treponema sp. TaxID=166 RepID=UPI0025FE4CD5|nr:ORF6N domain-containing protein [Treponema sp.]MBR4323757.1 ORF6N domain-containing protein [Treponema sp.]
MKTEISLYDTEKLKDKLFTIRGQQVMLDVDLAEIYGYETKYFNRQIKNNIERFDEDFRFQLTDEEVANLRCKNFTSSWGGSRYKPYAFTEQGIYMLMTVLKGELAISQSKMLIRMFKEMKHFIQNNAHIFVEIDNIKNHLLQSDIHQKETDKKVSEIFTLLDKYNVCDRQGIFFQGQIFDAYAKFESFIAQATQEIILIDNYVDLSILERFAKKQSNVSVTIFTAPKNKLTAQDIQKFNAQYPTLTVNHTTKMHDRFLIIDKQNLYHIGASLKDLGKKCFAFEVLDSSLIPLLLQNV